MSFSTTTTNLDAQQCCLQAHGRLDSTACADFEQTLLPLFDQGGLAVILDCQALEYVSSAGLRVILMAAKRATQTQGRLLLCQLQDNVREVLEISGFLKILDVHPDMQAARGALATAGN